MKTGVETILNEYGREINLDNGLVEMNGERMESWKQMWRKLKVMVKDGVKEKKKRTFNEKKMESEIQSKYTNEDYGWLECNTDPKKTAGIFNMQEQMVEMRAWISDSDSCRLCGEKKETVQQILAGCKKLAVIEYVRRHDNALKILAIEWGEERRSN